MGPITLIPGIGRIVPSITRIVSVPAPIVQIVRYSIGGSLGEELYGNFGLFMAPASVIAGFLISNVMRKRLNVTEKSGFEVGRYYIFFYFFINLVRSTFNEMLRSCVWSFLIIYLLLSITRRFRGFED